MNGRGLSTSNCESNEANLCLLLSKLRSSVGENFLLLSPSFEDPVMLRHNSNIRLWEESQMMTCGKWWNTWSHELVWSSSSRAIEPLWLLTQSSATYVMFCRWVVTDIESVRAFVCLGVCAEENKTPVNDINFLETSKTALIFKYVLTGTVHFDVGLLVHTMQRWENNWNRHARTYTHTICLYCI